MKILVFCIFLTFGTQINGQCNICNTTSLSACFSIDQFIPCDINGVFNLSAVATCAAGTLCNQNLGAGTPCGPISNGATCLGREISLLTTSTTSTSTTSTPTSTTSTPTSTTSTTSTATQVTTPLSSFNAKTFCSTRGWGRYAHPSYTTCGNYVYCYSYNSAMVGAVYTCVDGTNFNPGTGYCEPSFACAG